MMYFRPRERLAIILLLATSCFEAGSGTAIPYQEPEKAAIIMERVWKAGGSRERAARGKCWIDGECRNKVGISGGSDDDSEDAYRNLNVGQDERACLARARDWFERCGNRSVPETRMCVCVYV
jgi:hypothetical protein